MKIKKNENEDEKKEKEKEDENKEIEEHKEIGEKDELKDVIGAKYLKMDKSVCFLENSIFVVKAPIKEHGKPEVIEAKEKEIDNLETYETLKKWMI